MPQEDMYTVLARDLTNRAWAYRTDESVLDRDQGKWAFAVEQCAGRLRSEAAMKRVLNAFERTVNESKPLMNELLAVLHDVKEMYRDEAAENPSVQ